MHLLNTLSRAFFGSNSRFSRLVFALNNANVLPIARFEREVPSNV